jgi:nicotinate-nucleotide adenylyltransferase
MRIGLFGGSFNPVHAGHLHVMRTALARLSLDRIWMMVTPGNPLKDPGDLSSLSDRLAACRALVDDPRIDITAFEAAWQTRYSWQVVDRLTRARPGVRFVWLMGADNLAHFHRWQHWQRIAARVPIAVIDRPGATLAASSSRAAVALDRWAVTEAEARHLARMTPPAWTFLHAPRVPLSSTQLRAARKAAEARGS